MSKGKPLSELGDLDQPTQGAGGISRDTLEIKHFLRHLDDLLADPSLQWAESTLGGIRNTVQARMVITEGQRTAVANIRKHQGDSTQRRPTRRYEGF